MHLKFTPFFLGFIFHAFISFGQLSPDPLTYLVEGSKVKGYFFSSGQANAPTLFFTHGFTDSGNKWKIGTALSSSGINVFIIDFRGCYESEGKYSLFNAQKDIHEGLVYLKSSRVRNKYQIDTVNIILGGYSFGGGMVLTYALHHPNVEKVFTIAGLDVGRFSDELTQDYYLANMYAAIFDTVKKPFGPIDFKYEEPLMELFNDAEYFKVMDAEVKMQASKILLIAGREDKTVDYYQHSIPLYKHLKKSDSAVNLNVYSSGHSFEKVSNQVLTDIISWIKQIE